MFLPTKMNFLVIWKLLRKKLTFWLSPRFATPFEVDLGLLRDHVLETWGGEEDDDEGCPQCEIIDSEM